MSKKEMWEPCPRCGSNRVESRGIAFFVITGIALIGISIWLLIIPPVGIAGIIAGIVFLLAAPFSRGILQCKDCNKSWRYKPKKDQTSV